jgi:hypothetical protein
MAKCRIKFKLGEIKISGVELEIEDDREQATATLAALQNQIAGVVQPAVSKALLGAGQVIDASPVNGQQAATPAPRKPRRKLTSSAPAKAAEDGAQPIAFVHDPEKFGNPQQGWTAANKAMWLLWVVEQAANVKELTPTAIANVFNQHYRDFGMILKGNVRRDLGILRTKTPSLVGTDTNRSPQVWFLSASGKSHAERLAKGWDGKGN